MRKRFRVTAKRWSHGWELHIRGVGVTQSRSLIDAEEMARDFIALDLDVPPDSFDVEVAPQVSQVLDAEIKAARRATAEAAVVLEAAARRSREAARHLREAGLTGRDIAAVLRVSPQRVSQLLQG